MHISEGVLSTPVLVGGAALAAAGTAVGLKQLDPERIASAGVLSAAFFVASLIHLPVGPSSVHLVMNGLVGLMLGMAAFPVILTALLLQAVFFQFGGFTSLGVNTVIMALPAAACRVLFAGAIRKEGRTATLAAFACGSLAVLFSALLAAAALVFTREDFLTAAGLLVGSNLPVMIVEGIVTAFAVLFIKKVAPELLGVAPEGS